MSDRPDAAHEEDESRALRRIGVAARRRAFVDRKLDEALHPPADDGWIYVDTDDPFAEPDHG